MLRFIRWFLRGFVCSLIDHGDNIEYHESGVWCHRCREWVYIWPRGLR